MRIRALLITASLHINHPSVMSWLTVSYIHLLVQHAGDAGGAGSCGREANVITYFCRVAVKPELLTHSLSCLVAERMPQWLHWKMTRELLLCWNCMQNSFVFVLLKSVLDVLLNPLASFLPIISSFSRFSFVFLLWKSSLLESLG